MNNSLAYKKSLSFTWTLRRMQHSCSPNVHETTSVQCRLLSDDRIFAQQTPQYFQRAATKLPIDLWNMLPAFVDGAGKHDIVQLSHILLIVVFDLLFDEPPRLG